MNALGNPFEQHLHRIIDAIVPNISTSLAQIESIDPDASQRVLSELVSHACQATNDAMIIAARKAIAAIPPEWLEPNLRKIVKHLNLDDEWEYRRWLELLFEVRPAMMAPFIIGGLSSLNAAVREAAQDFAAGRYGPIDGLGDVGLR